MENHGISLSAEILREKVTRANVRLHSLIAREYDDRQAVFHPAVLRSLLDFTAPHLTPRKGLAVDIGAGTAFVPRLLEQYPFNWNCVDVCPEMLHVARERFPHASFVVADAFSLPFSGGRFDLASVSGVLHHVVDYRALLAEAARVLRPGGLLLILNEPNAAGYRLFSPLRTLTSSLIPEKRVARHVRDGALEPGDETLAEYRLHHAPALSPRRVEQAAEKLGLHVVELKFTNLNILANLGDRLSFDILGALPAAALLHTGRFAIDFNMVLEKHA